MKVINISFNEKEYKIQKEKLMFVLEKLNYSKVKDFEIETLMQKFGLYDEYFLENVNRI